MERNKSSLNKHTILILIFLPAISSATYIHQFLERPVIEALNSRDNFYKKVGIIHDKTTFNLLRTQNGIVALKNQLEMNIDLFSPWYRFLLGIVHLDSSEETVAINFDEAIKCAQNNPGTIWVLFFEFLDAGQEVWAEKCLEQLEKQFLSVGAQSAPILSQQLMTIARSQGFVGNNNKREKYYKWSSSFERFPFWQTLSQGVSHLPNKPGQFIDAYTKCINMLYKSWNLQIKIFSHLYRWFRYALLFFIFIVLLTFSLKYLPIALHRLTCLFPHSASPRLRFALVLAIFLSFIILGIIPFLLFVALFLWPYLEKSKKKLTGFIIGLLILSPVDSRIQEIFRVTLSDNQPLGLLQRSIAEGYHTNLENQIMEYIEHHDSDYLSHISAAIVNLKKNDPVAALIHIKHYEELIGNDPVALLTAGNIYYSNDDLEKAKMYYTKCLNTFPQNEFALFNLGQVNLSLLNTAKSTEQVSKAADINPALISTFLEKNARYFSDSLPKLRRFIQPEYKPMYFWKHLFLKYCGSWESTKKMWGPTTLGISPLLFLLISPILIIILIKFNKSNSNILYCKLCSSTMCTKCRIGLLCINCAQKIGTIHDDKIKNDKRIKIQDRAVITDTIFITSLNILFPGAGELFRKNTIGYSDSIVVIITSIVYGAYLSLLTINISYPFWVVKNYFLFLFLSLFTYNFFFGVYYVRALSIELKPEHMEETSYVT